MSGCAVLGAKSRNYPEISAFQGANVAIFRLNATTLCGRRFALEIPRAGCFLADLFVPFFIVGFNPFQSLDSMFGLALNVVRR